MQDPSKILDKAKGLAAGRDISQKRTALAYYTLYSAVKKDTKEAEQFIETLLAEEKKAGKRGFKYSLFGEMFRPKSLEEHANNLRGIFKNLLGEQGLAILRRILDDPLRSIDAVPHMPNLAAYIKTEYNCKRETAFALALFTTTWPDEIRRVRDYLLERKNDP